MRFTNFWLVYIYKKALFSWIHTAGNLRKSSDSDALVGCGMLGRRVLFKDSTRWRKNKQQQYGAQVLRDFKIFSSPKDAKSCCDILNCAVTFQMISTRELVWGHSIFCHLFGNNQTWWSHKSWVSYVPRTTIHCIIYLVEETYVQWWGAPTSGGWLPAEDSVAWASSLSYCS